jgi:hypothetical protein
LPRDARRSDIETLKQPTGSGTISRFTWKTASKNGEQMESLLVALDQPLAVDNPLAQREKFKSGGDYEKSMSKEQLS